MKTFEICKLSRAQELYKMMDLGIETQDSYVLTQVQMAKLVVSNNPMVVTEEI